MCFDDERFLFIPADVQVYFSFYEYFSFLFCEFDWIYDFRAGVYPEPGPIGECDGRTPAAGTISWLNSCACAGLPFGLRSTCLELTLPFLPFYIRVGFPSRQWSASRCWKGPVALFHLYCLVPDWLGWLPDSLFRHLSAAGWHTSRLLITKEERLPCW